MTHAPRSGSVLLAAHCLIRDARARAGWSDPKPERRTGRELGLTVEEYEVVLRIARAPGMRMRDVDLVAQPLLTAAKATRVLDQLERGRLVDRGRDADDGDLLYVTLTDAGRAKTHDATANHAAQVEELFGSLFEGDESLQAVLARLANEPGSGAQGTAAP